MSTNTAEGWLRATYRHEFLMGGFSIYGGSADELVLTSGAKDYEGSPRLESNLWTSCISYVHRDSSLGGRASGCREESYTSIFPLMWLYRYIHSAPVYVPPLFMCLMIKFPSFSCFRNFLEIESDSELEEKKNGIRYTMYLRELAIVCIP